MTLSIFKCISCDNEYDIQEIRYRCDCGELLEIIHDLSQSIPNPNDWKKSLNGQMTEIAFRRYQAIIFPSLPEDKLITLFEGDTPLYDISPKFPQFGSLHLKHEGLKFKPLNLLSVNIIARHS